MAQSQQACTIEVENHFGPSVGAACYGGLDFTLYFEEAFLSIAPSCALIIAAALRCFVIQQYSVKTKGGWLHPLKLLSLSLFTISQILLLAFWARSGTPRTDLTTAATAFRFLSSLACGYLSHQEHFRCVRPSKILNLFFFFTILFDIPQARTIWIIRGLHTVAAIFITGMAVKALVLIVEAWEKPRLVKAEYLEGSPETWASVINRGLFWWFNPLLFRGAKKALSMPDLFELEKCMVPDEYGNHKLKQLWEQCENKEKSGAMIMPLLKTFKWQILAGVIPRLCQIGFTFAQPFLVRAATKLFAMPDGDNARGRGIALLGAYAIVYSGIAVSTATAQHKTYRVITMMRGVLISMIFEKATSVKASMSEDAAALTLMSTDIERITSCLRFLHDVWAAFVEIAIALWLLYNELSTAGIAPILIAFACTVIALKVAMVAGERQNLWIEAIQKRVAVTAEMLGAMKGVKMLGLKDLLFSKVHGLREKEIIASQKFRALLIAVVALANFNTLLTPIVSLTIYAMGSRDGKYGYLDSARALTSLTLFNLFAVFVGSLVESVTDTAMSLECIDRIREYLAKDSHEDLRETVRPGSVDEKAPSFELKNVDIGWKGGEAPILHDLSFTIERSSVTMVVGPVGCGKTTLMKGLLGEVNCMTGKMRVNCDRIAYCGQDTWLTNGTVKENILGASDFNEAWYLTVVQACGLEKDFEELNNGDQTVVGSKGVSLSGGQKQRLTLARALYSNIETIIIDDGLSGLDPTTEEHIYMHVLGPAGIARAHGLTIIMVTNSVHRLIFADLIVALNPDGTVLTQGSFDDVRKKLDYIQTNTVAAPPPIQMKSEMPKAVGTTANAPFQEQAVMDARKTSDFKTYLYYLGTAPWYNWATYFGFMAIFVFFQAFPTVWVTWWARDNEKQPNLNLSMRIGVYWLFGVMGATFLLATAWFYMLNIVGKTANVVHRNLLRAVLNAPMSFFASTDSGVTINRFSQDLELIDMELPLAVLNTCLAMFLCVAQLVIIAASAKYITATIPLCILVYYLIGTFYIRTSRQLRIMDIEAKSPLFSNFMELLSGLITIRAFSWQEKYKSDNQRLLTQSQRPFYLLYTVQRWLSLVLDMTVTGFVLVLVGIAVGTMGTTSASFLGLALVNVVALSASIKALITDWTVLETSLGAVTRIKHFTETTESEDLPGESDLPPDDWTSYGSIEFRNVSAFYRDPSAPVLKNVSFNIRKGEKIAICGRSGSGKSTLVSSLFRMIELSEGAILVDGVNISTLPRQDIRSAIVGLPQDPYVLEGSSIRENVDPFDYNPDEAIINTLRRVELWDMIESKGGLDAIASADLFSHGQRQLLCMAKAMLRQGHIVVFDEATSGVDTKTDEMMQELISSSFADYTVLTVTHRLDTIIDYDRVLVMDNGILLENDAPRILLASPSIFRELYKSSRGWEEYERQERLERDRIEQERHEAEQRQRVARDPADRDRTKRYSRYSYHEGDVVDEKEEPETYGAIREHWNAVNQLFGNMIPGPRRNRSRSRGSIDRERRYSNPQEASVAATYGRDRRSLTGLVARTRL